MSKAVPDAARNGIGNLAGLLDDLHHADRLAIGVDRAQHAAILLQRLGELGMPIEDAAAACRWLAPVLCVTARDRAVLLERLRRRAGSGERAPPVAPRELRGEVAERQSLRRHRRPWLIAALLILVGAGVLFGLVAGGGGAVSAIMGEVGTKPTGLAHLARFGAAATLATFLGLLLPGLYLFRRRAGGALPPLNPRPTGAFLDLFDPGTLHGPLRLTGRQRRVAGRWLDLPSTLQQTLRRAGWPTLVRGGRLRTPEHLLLVELDTGADARVLTAYALLDRLQKADLRAAAFVFVGQPDQLRPIHGGHAQTLAQVAARFASARLLLVSDGTVFFDAFAAAAVSPAELVPFATRILLTPTPAAAWSDRESAYDREGWFVVEQSTEGVAKLAHWLAGPRELPLLLQPGAAADLPTALAHDWRLFSERPPSAQARAELVDDVAAWLDPNVFAPPRAFDALRVLAMAGLLGPGAVERVLAHLKRLGGPAPDEGGLRRLLRLPWLGRGTMPLWLRDDLVRGLPDLLLAQGRQAWLLHLAGRDPADALPAGEATRRLQAEANRRTADAAQADDLSRTLLGLRPSRRWLPGWRDLPIMALLLLAGLASGAALPRLPALLDAVCGRVGPCAAIVPTFRTIAFSPGAMGVAVVAAVASFWMRAAGFRRALEGVSLCYVLVTAATLTQPAFEVRGNAFAGAIVVVCLCLLILRAQNDRPSLRTLVAAPSHPWMNALAACMAAAAILVDSAALEWVSPNLDLTGIPIITASAVGAATAGLAFAIAWGRVRDLTPALPIRAGAVAAASSALTTLLGVQQLVPLAAMVGSMFQLVGLATAIGLLAAARTCVRVPWSWLAMIACGSYAVQFALLDPWLAVPLSPPAMYLLMAAPFASRGTNRLRQYGLVLGVALLAYAAAAAVGGTALGMLLAVGVQWLLLWPALAALHPAVRVASTGLWWRCLLLVACSVQIDALPFGVRGAPVLLIPLAAWIAARDGPPAVPAIALAIMPSFLSLSAGGPTFGGSAGFGLAAVLVAAFVARRSFREACLAADRIAWWQVAGLIALSINVRSMWIRTDLWALWLTCAYLIALSHVPLRPVAAILGTTTVTGCLVGFTNWGVSMQLGQGTMAVVSSFSATPADIVSFLLALYTARALVGPGGWPPPAPRWTWLGPALLVAYIVEFNYQNRDLIPLAPGHFLLLVLFWAAIDRRIGGFSIRIGRFDVPWPAATLAPFVLVDMLPSVSFAFGPFRVSLFGRSVLSAAAAVAAAWMFHVMGRGLRGLLPQAGASSRQTSPLFGTAPVWLGLGLVAVAAAIYAVTFTG